MPNLPLLKRRRLNTSLHGEYNGFLASGNFSADLDKAMKETVNNTDVTVWMRQRGGQEAQAAFTGPDATKILARLNDFPTSAHQHPIGYEAQLASYNTIPIPIPPPEEREDQALVLADCAQQKIGFLSALSDLALASSDDTSMLFDDLPSKDDLNRLKGQYRIALNALMSHAIRSHLVAQPREVHQHEDYFADQLWKMILNMAASCPS